MWYSDNPDALRPAQARRLGAEVFPLDRRPDFHALVRFISTFVDLNSPSPEAA